MLLLGIDTSAGATAALIDTDRTSGEALASFASSDSRHHAEELTPAIADILAALPAGRTTPDAVVVGTGPGPFTGLRAGIMTARTLGFAWSIPVYGVGSLDGLAQQAADAGADGEFVVATDARRREVYWARAQAEHESVAGGAHIVDGPHVGPAEELPALPTWGAGAQLYADRIPGQVREAIAPYAASLARVAATRLAAAQDLSDTAPQYLRESDAKVPGERKRALR